MTIVAFTPDPCNTLLRTLQGPALLMRIHYQRSLLMSIHPQSGVTECGYSGFSGYSGCSESTRLNVDSVNPQTTECGYSESTID
jgi:hypothetical protein